MILKTWINGKTITGEGSLPVSDLGLLRGFSVFEYMRTYNKVPFKLDRYLLRFQRSCRLAGMQLMYSIEDIRRVILNLISDIHEDCAIRMLLTGGCSHDGYTPSTPNFLILIEDLLRYDSSLYEGGMVLVPANYLRYLPEAKTTNYFFALSNFFILKDFN